MNSCVEKIEKKYGDLNGCVSVVDLNKGQTGLGLSLAGNKDRTRMSVFVCGMHPQGSAAKDGRVRVADEILEVRSLNVFHFLFSFPLSAESTLIVFISN